MISTAAAGVSEWLGPLVPIAISSFFGITFLAGFSQFGGDLLGSNNFISNNPVLSNPAVFWIFLGLTVVTSIPRFSKVSKPAAQAIDQLEAYAGIITIVLIRVLMSVSESDPINPQTAMVVEMGIFSFASDVLLSVAAIINIMVINTVKFCFEVMVWLIPFPFVDGMLEVANKAACAGLMAIYVWSPFVATILNLLIFVVCLFVFRWANRRVQYMRSVLCDPIWAMISKPYGLPKNPRLTVFPQSGIGPFPAKSKLLLTKTGAGWQLARASWILPPKTMELASNNVRMQMHRGMLLNSIAVSGNENNKLLFSKRYSKHLVKLSELINVPEAEEAFEVDLRSDLGTA
ncbi:MAG: hypothetical protein AB8B55_07870 [Mariniblastus sp.]